MIEADGEVHFDTEAEKYDARRTRALTKYGLRVLRFSNKQILERFEDVCRTIAENL